MSLQDVASLKLLLQVLSKHSTSLAYEVLKILCNNDHHLAMTQCCVNKKNDHVINDIFVTI
jgi:hypothetical protein